MFEQISRVPPDVILGLIAAYKADPNPNKVDLGVGVYQTEEGLTPVLDCVKEAETALNRSESSKAYLGPRGVVGFNESISRLLLGPDHPALEAGRITTIQTPGGTGALRVAGEVIKYVRPDSTIWVPTPTWPNHEALFPAAGFSLERYRYRDGSTGELDFAGMLEDLGQLGPNDVVVMHACCHNPAGIDLNAEQWSQVVDLGVDRGFLPLVDMAYQGFGVDLDTDAILIRLLADRAQEFMVTSSCSKNFGLYRERCGAISMVLPNRDKALDAESIINSTTRGIYSMPPTHGPGIVDLILKSEELTARWHDELAAMRDRINGQRSKLVQKLRDAGVQRDFSFIERQFGMFSLLGISPEEVARLRDEFSIYLVGDTRFNVAGLRDNNLDYFVSSVYEVLA
ncbi:MAG: amino acid aminotransferase [Pseudomonadota bacterium]